jgi:hypothetical protein
MKNALPPPWMVPFVGLLALHFLSQRRYQSELAELRRELGAPSTPMSAPRAQTEGRPEAARPVPAPAAPKQVVEDPASAAIAPPKAPPVDMTEMREQLEESFTKQRTDARWTDEARRTAETRLSVILPETSKLQALECRTSMCRIETVHQGLESYRQFVQDAFMNPETKLWNGGFFLIQLADPVDGKLVTIAYLARDGAKLPPIGKLP